MHIYARLRIGTRTYRQELCVLYVRVVVTSHYRPVDACLSQEHANLLMARHSTPLVAQRSLDTLTLVKTRCVRYGALILASPELFLARPCDLLSTNAVRIALRMQSVPGDMACNCLQWPLVCASSFPTCVFVMYMYRYT